MQLDENYENLEYFLYVLTANLFGQPSALLEDFLIISISISLDFILHTRH